MRENRPCRAYMKIDHRLHQIRSEFDHVELIYLLEYQPIRPVRVDYGLIGGLRRGGAVPIGRLRHEIYLQPRDVHRGKSSSSCPDVLVIRGGPASTAPTY